MYIELNLVSNQSIFSPVYTLIARERKLVNDDSEVITAICEFISDNITSFDAALSDKELVSRLQNLDQISIVDFYSIKFMLANSGLDILVNSVAELEVNADQIPEGMLEYNVVDNIATNQSFVKPSSKIVLDADSSDLHQVYSEIVSGFGFFQTPILSGYRNPLTANLDLLKQTEVAIGVAPTSITTYINSVLEYLGKSIILIQN